MFGEAVESHSRTRHGVNEVEIECVDVAATHRAANDTVRLCGNVLPQPTNGRVLRVVLVWVMEHMLCGCATTKPEAHTASSQVQRATRDRLFEGLGR